MSGIFLDIKIEFWILFVLSSAGSPQQSRGGKKLFFNFSQILQKSKTTYAMKAGYEISFKYDALNHQKKHFKVHENTACLTEGGIYEVKKGIKES